MYDIRILNLYVHFGKTISCFETYGKAAHFEGRLKCSIADNRAMGNTAKCSENTYPLIEFTKDRMVFLNAIFIGDQTSIYVLERNYFFSTNF